MRRTVLSPQIIGYRKDGRPIQLIQGGAEDGGGGAGGDGGQAGAGGAGDQGGQQQSGGTPGPFDNVTDPAELRAIAVRLQNEAAQNGGKAREAARAAAADEARKALTTDIAKALGLAPDDKADPVELQRKIESLTSANTERDRELAIYREALAPGMGVNVGRLLDSRSFMRKAAGIDPASDTAGADIKALISEALSSDQSLRAAAGAAGSGSLEHSGGAGDQRNTDLSKLHGADAMAAAYAHNSAK